MSPTRNLVVMAKAPVMGRVKSRLAADIGLVPATRFYRTTLAGLLRRLGRDPRWLLWLAVTPDSAANDPGAWPERARLIPQGAGDLGDRMARILAPLQGGRSVGLPPGPVVLIGSDIPAIQPTHIAAAFSALGRHSLVFGPASDGGYWLVGTNRRPAGPRDLFRNVRWSTEHALADTLANVPTETPAFLETLDDIDNGVVYARLLPSVRPLRLRGLCRHGRGL